ncbi:MAG TPA: heme peroxidase, partial [Anaerolineae bacterium]
MTTLHGNLSDIVAPRSRFYQGPYGRLFPDLSPHQPSKDSLLALAQQMVEPADKEDNEQIPAAYTYFGQLVTHDITFDSTSSLMRLNDPNRLYNFRTPRFDLDSLYGAGPEVTPYFYDQKRYGYLLTGKGGS